uniref:Uncharacterized protein n=1 Tax=Chondria sp. (in: red algae) TaxID=1982705 RepID=A0A1Z1MEH3_9FLOR|nr:hypothetical protein [Chondria sp. (in: red algae)]
MKNKIPTKKKIDLLIISLEAISTLYISNFVDHMHDNKFHYNYNKTKSLLRLYINNRNKNNVTVNHFVNFIIYTYITYNNLNILCLSKIANDLIKNDLQQKQSYKIRKYLKKFNYLYFYQHDHYYNIKSSNYVYKTNINTIAVINLYLIAQLKQKQGVFTLIKYLNF